MKNRSIFAVLAIAIVLAMTINVAYAGTATSASIIMTDAAGDPIPNSEYLVGQPIYVKIATANTGGTVDLEIVDYETNDHVAYPTASGPFVVGQIVEFAPLPAGHYLTYANRVSSVSFRAIASGSFFVVPESMLGTLTATVAGFAAFATIGIVKHKHAKSK